MYVVEKYAAVRQFVLGEGNTYREAAQGDRMNPEVTSGTKAESVGVF
jgi:hypothetical protein